MLKFGKNLKKNRRVEIRSERHYIFHVKSKMNAEQLSLPIKVGNTIIIVY